MKLILEKIKFCLKKSTISLFFLPLVYLSNRIDNEPNHLKHGLRLDPIIDYLNLA